MSLFDISKIEKRLGQLEKETLRPSFWQEKNSNLVLKEIELLKTKKEEYIKLQKE